MVVEPSRRPALPRELPEWAPTAGRALTVLLCVAIVVTGGIVIKGILFPPAAPGADVPEPARTALRIACPVWAEAPPDGGVRLGGTAIAMRPHLEQAAQVPEFAGLPEAADTIGALAPRVNDPDVALTDAAAFSRAFEQIDSACGRVGY